MGFQFEQVASENIGEVISFLRETFGAAPDAGFLQPDQVRWQFFEPRPDWEGSRSYALRAGGRMVAHAGVVPSRSVTPDGNIVRSIVAIDWAANPSYPGTGLWLLQELASLADIRVGFRGSAVVRAIVRKAHSGKKRTDERIIGEVITARRTFRPWMSVFRAPSFRALARAGREVSRNIRRPLRPAGDWTAVPVDRFDGLLPDLRLRDRRPNLVLPLRSPELLNYMLRCPSVRFSGYLIRKGEEIRGHLLLGDLGEEIRLADLVIDSDVIEDWADCYSLAAATARRDYPRAASLAATAAPTPLQPALDLAGYTTFTRAPMTLRENRSVLPSGYIPVVNMMDSDAAYLH